MGGTKRPRESDGNIANSTSPFIPIFDGFRSELDEHHDRRERIIKSSRDVTALSKKIIFTLQRTRKLRAPLPPNLQSDVENKTESIINLLTAVSKDLQGINAYRYYRQISGALQEFVEALTFKHYLETQSLLTYAETAALLPTGIHLSEDDYLLGIFDMTGELMRFAITIIATHGQIPTAETPGQSTILADMQTLRLTLEGLKVPSGSSLSRDFDQKMKVMKASVEKVENGVYEIMIRGKERPKGWIPDMKSSEADREVEAW